MSKGVVSAERMAHEMEEVVQTLKDLNVSSIMAEATGEKLDWCRQLDLREFFSGKPPEALHEILKIMEERSCCLSGKK